jgi:IS30 family transposase
MPRKYIDQRSQMCTERREKGHWERDLLEGQRGGHALLVLQDRVTRKTKLRRVTSHHADHVNQMTIEALHGETVHSITNDNGVEFGRFAELEKAMGVPVYYCHAYTSWERGMVENTNGLLRQFFPKGFNFNQVDDEKIQMAENTINLRPRKMLGYRSAEEIHEQRTMKLVRSESYYRRSMNRREEEIFKQSMIREVGFFIDNNGEILLH